MINLAWNPGFCAQSPLFAVLASIIDPAWSLRTDWPTFNELNHLLAARHVTNHRGQVLQLVEQLPQQASAELRYEPSLYDQGYLLTRRASWHDFFNLLVWLGWPRSKAAINYGQYHALQRRIPAYKQRTALENKLTHLDENGVIVVSSNAQLLGLLRAQQWHALFWQRRAQVEAEMRFFILGHALYEKLLNPYLGLTGSALLFERSSAFFARALPQQLTELDEVVSTYLYDARQLTALPKLAPVPILGIPGCWAANINAHFYDDKTYFRDPAA